MPLRRGAIEGQGVPAPCVAPMTAEPGPAGRRCIPAVRPFQGIARRGILADGERPGLSDTRRLSRAGTLRSSDVLRMNLRFEEAVLDPSRWDLRQDGSATGLSVSTVDKCIGHETAPRQVHTSFPDDHCRGRWCDRRAGMMIRRSSIYMKRAAEHAEMEVEARQIAENFEAADARVYRRFERHLQELGEKAKGDPDLERSLEQLAVRLAQRASEPDPVAGFWWHRAAYDADLKAQVQAGRYSSLAAY